MQNLKYTLKDNFPKLLSFYYKLRFIFRAFYKKEPRAHLFWILRRGDNRFHKKHNLNENSVFFDVGGFEGKFTEKILNEFDCKSYIFEPHPVYFKILKDKYIKNENVKVFEYGLGNINQKLYLTDESSGSRIVDYEAVYKISIKNINEVIDELDIVKIDLLKLNIEGSEYELLDHLIDTGRIEIVESLLVQFHENVPNYINYREKIRKHLSKTHTEIFSYYFVWERWDKK
jgi:FkbM family methyltransferase